MMSTPEAECRKFWARFSIEISDARGDARTADAAVQDRLTAIENFVLRNYSTLWQLHEKRLAPESSPGDLNGSRCEQFNRAAAELAMAFLRWGEALKDSDYVLLNVHDEPVTLAGRYGRCYAEVWHDVVLEQLSLLRDIRPQHSIDMRHCKSGWFYFRGTKRRLPDGMLTVEFEGDCSPADLAAVNTAFAASLDFNFAGQVAAGTANGKQVKRKRGRRKQAKAFDLVEQAVRNYHKFEGGIVDERVPPITGRDLAELAKPAFSARTADRWFVARFKSKEAYELACRDGSLGQLLAIDLDDVRAFGTFDPSKNEVRNDDGDTDEQDDAHMTRGPSRSSIVRKF